VVVPCHNEETNIGPLVDALEAAYGHYITSARSSSWTTTAGIETAEVAAYLARRNPRVKVVTRRQPSGVGRARGRLGSRLSHDSLGSGRDCPASCRKVLDLLGQFYAVEREVTTLPAGAAVEPAHDLLALRGPTPSRTLPRAHARDSGLGRSRTGRCRESPSHGRRLRICSGSGPPGAGRTEDRSTGVLPGHALVS
jgi:hypothetical protein